MKNIAPLLIPSLGHNPRRIKRLVNKYNFMSDLTANRYEGQENPLEPEQVLHWLIVEEVYRGFVKLVREKSWTYVPEIRKNIGQLEDKMTPENREAWRVDDEIIKEIGALALAEFLKDRYFVAVVKALPREEEKIKQLISFTTAVTVREKESAPPAESDRFDLYTKVITQGSFNLAETRLAVAIEDDYEMGVYPVTNSQYKRFLDARGYDADAYWSPEGIEWKKKEEISTPRYWTEAKWNKPDYPVVGVSWYEANAYCRWLSAREKQRYCLPTEAQWEKAASWDEEKQVALVFPWGDEFDKEKCNTRESGEEGMTPVERYPQGRSPYGCHDMSGNVWEWTDSWYDENQKGRVLRGGSWNYNQEIARCANRYWNYPTSVTAVWDFVAPGLQNDLCPFTLLPFAAAGGRRIF